MKVESLPSTLHFENAVVGLVGEEHIALAVASRPFGEGETPRQLLQRCARSDDLALRRQHVRGANDTQEELDEVFHFGLTALIEVQCGLV